MEEQLLFVQEHYRDTMDKERAVAMSEYYNLKKGFNHFSEKEQEFRKEIAFSREQLDNMITDLENSNMEIDSFNKYYEMEMEAILDINKRVQDATNILTSAFSKYDKIHEDIDAFVIDLRAQVDSTNSE